MQPKFLLVNFLITLAAAAPSPQTGTDEVADVLQGTATSGAADNGGFSTLALKNWQAAGGCKTDWDEDNRCLNQCIGEANSKCPGWKTMQGWIQGGCVLSWRTCRCNCEY
ncbi:hypothetical protein B0T14DRAFT_508183 [Immersiella caudata]|uniref:Uncharacterized protein n=1 Tax=Immersiella caudata TaxID=314043 RepID=A0AA40CE10_9PEZI|nr:hypothetical protein B0T14DRAFT_508183 [Immersiella caudata]